MLDLTLTDLKVYQQYAKVQWFKDYIKCLNQLRNELFLDYINQQFIPAINIQNSENLYLAYYVQYVFGLYRPLGASSTNTFYDTGDKYDSLTAQGNPIIYDDSEDYNGRISLKEFIILLRFALNYGEEIINQPLIINFVSEICDLSPTEIKIEFPDMETLKIILPNTIATQNFLKTTIQYYDWLGLPFGVNLDFVIQE